MVQEQISLFVSSTFRDMHLERDILHHEVMPKLVKQAQRYGKTVQMLDLRWGVNTTNLDKDEGACKVMNVCMDAIDRCRPYILILLGERYGWSPDPRLMHKVLQRRGFMLDELERSVTELEIEYGALSARTDIECFVYFRQMDYENLATEQKEIYLDNYTPDDHARMQRLKKRLEEKFSGRIRYYTPGIVNGIPLEFNGFAEAVYQDIASAMSTLWGGEKHLCWQEREYQSLRQFSQNVLQDFVGRESLIGEYCNRIGEVDEQIQIIQGEAGSGKSAIICKMEYELTQREMDVIGFYCGRSAYTSDGKTMLQYFVYHMGKMLDLPAEITDKYKGRFDKPSDFDLWQDLLGDLLETHYKRTKKPVIFLIDALDQLQDNEITEKFLWAPAGGVDHWKVFATCLPTQIIARACVKDTLPPLTREESKMVLSRIANKNYKSIDGPVALRILSRSDADNPLCLQLIMARLLLLDRADFLKIQSHLSDSDDMTAINNHLSSIVDALPQGAHALSMNLLHTAITIGDAQWLHYALSALTATRFGMRMSDFEALYVLEHQPWSALSFEWLRYFLSFCFVERHDGCIDFFHRSLREGFETEYPEEVARLRVPLARIFLSCDSSALLREGVHQLFMARNSMNSIDLLGETIKIAIEKDDMLLLTQYLIAVEETLRVDGGEWLLSGLTGENSVTRKAITDIVAMYFIINSYEDDFSEHGKIQFDKLWDACIQVLKSELQAKVTCTSPDSLYVKLARFYALKAGLTSLTDSHLAIRYCADVEHWIQTTSTKKLDYRDIITLATCYPIIAEIEYRDERYSACIETIKRGKTFLIEQHIDLLSDTRVKMIDVMLDRIEGWLTGKTKIGHPEKAKNDLKVLQKNIIFQRVDYEVTASIDAANALACMLSDLINYYKEHDMPLEGLSEKEELVRIMVWVNAKVFSSATLNELADAYNILAEHYGLINEDDLALECYQKATEQLKNADIQISDVKSRIKLCASLLNEAIHLYFVKKKIKSSTVCFTMLDLFEEVIDQPCTISDTEDKRNLMDTCANLLERLLEFEAQKQCLEFAYSYSLELGDNDAVAAYRKKLNSSHLKLFG